MFGITWCLSAQSVTRLCHRHPFGFQISSVPLTQPQETCLYQEANCTVICRLYFGMQTSSVYAFWLHALSTSDYACPNKSTDWVLISYNGYTSYLLVINDASQYTWVFLTKSKDPPIDIVHAFLIMNGHPDGGCIQVDQGDKLASKVAFWDILLQDFRYILEPMGTDSPSQNGAVEIYNNNFGIWTRSLLYGAGLPAKYWSAALVHAVYLHNRLVHLATSCTPFEYYYKMKPDLEYLKTFGSRVCQAFWGLAGQTGPQRLHWYLSRVHGNQSEHCLLGFGFGHR